MSSPPGRAGHPSAQRSPRSGGIVVDETSSYQQLAIIEKYEPVIEYLYPIIQNIPRQHGIVRDRIINVLFEQVELFNSAGKTNQASRLHLADANLASLRHYLRFMASPKRRFINPKKQAVAEALIAEVGGMLNAWLKTVKNRG